MISLAPYSMTASSTSSENSDRFWFPLPLAKSSCKLAIDTDLRSLSLELEPSFFTLLAELLSDIVDFLLTLLLLR